jgi:hypothetical protein
MGLVLAWDDLLMALVEMELDLSKCPPRWFFGRPGPSYDWQLIR